MHEIGMNQEFFIENYIKKEKNPAFSRGPSNIYPLLVESSKVHLQLKLLPPIYLIWHELE